MRPSDYNRRFRVQWFEIFLVLLKKILTARWSSEFSKQRQRYWMKGFRLHACLKGNVWELIDQLKALVKLTRSAVLGTHSTRFYEIKPYRDPPHLIFRLTSESRF